MNQTNKKILVLSGSPASGKSTLLSRLTQHFPSTFIKIDDILQTSDEFFPESFHIARQILIQRAETWAMSNEEGLLIIEDTNHLRSLVKPFRMLCQVYLIPFIHLVLRVPLSLALERNEHRLIQVPRTSLEKIWNQINDEKFFNESIEIYSDVDEMGWLVEKIQTAKIPSKQTSTHPKTDPGYKHFLDCKLRKAINQRLTQFNGNKKSLAKNLLSFKSTFLKHLKNLTLTDFPKILNESLTEISKIS
jgi:predicted kinase